MWQEVLAVDSRLCAARKMDKDLRPLYLKRRMQLIKAAEDEYEASQLGQVRKRLPKMRLMTLNMLVWSPLKAYGVVRCTIHTTRRYFSCHGILIFCVCSAKWTCQRLREFPSEVHSKIAKFLLRLVCR